MNRDELIAFMLTVIGIATVIFLMLLTDAYGDSRQDLGWLAQRQMQARQDCAELLKYRMRW